MMTKRNFKYYMAIVLTMIWIYWSYSIYNIQTFKNLAPFKVIIYCILMPPALLTVGCACLALLIAYCDIGYNAYSNLFNGNNLKVEEVLWLMNDW